MSQSPIAPQRFNEIAGISLDRLKGISDGIFSVGMTLLVLGLAVPVLGSRSTEGELWQALVNLGPSVLIYTMSFMTLGIFWVGQGSQTGQLLRSNRPYTWLAQGLYAFSAALSIFFPTWVSIALIVLVQLNYVIAPRIPVLHRF